MMILRFVGVAPYTGIPPARFTRDLGFVEQITLWSIRAWIAGFRSGEEMQGVMHQALDMMDAADALAYVDAAMTILSVSVKRPMDVGCPKCRHVTPDEGRLLLALALTGRGMEGQVGKLLDPLVTATGIRAIQSCLKGWTDELGKAGLEIPLRELV